MIAKSSTNKGWGGRSGRCVVKAVELTFYEQKVVKAFHKLTAALESSVKVLPGLRAEAP
jgi:hypothetical protein